MSQIKVYTIFERPETTAEDVYQEIYEWEYLDTDGKLQKDKKNVKEEIQSYLPRTDYKTQIERGELELKDGGTSYTDFRDIPDGSVAIYDYLNAIANLPEEQITKLMEQINGGDKKGVQGKQGTDSKTAEAGQTDEADVQSKSTNAKTSADHSGQSKEKGTGE